jgi:hypothetical protein
MIYIYIYVLVIGLNHTEPSTNEYFGKLSAHQRYFGTRYPLEKLDTVANGGLEKRRGSWPSKVETSGSGAEKQYLGAAGRYGADVSNSGSGAEVPSSKLT